MLPLIITALIIVVSTIGVTGYLWLMGREVVQLRDALTGKPLGMTRKQFERYCYCLGTKDPVKIAKVVSEIRARRDRLQAQRTYNSNDRAVKSRDQLRMLQQLSKTLIVLALVALPTLARAQTSVWEALAYYHFGEGYYADKDYTNALRSFREGWDILPMPEFAFDMALTHAQLDNVYAARDWLRIYWHNHPSKEDRPRAEKLGDTLAAAIDADMTDQDMSFACDVEHHICGIMRWPPSVMQRWVLFSNTGR